MGIKQRLMQAWSAAKTTPGAIGLIIFLLVILLIVWRFAGDVEFIVDNWETIKGALKDWGPLIGFVLAAILVGKALYDTSGPMVVGSSKSAPKPASELRSFSLEPVNLGAWDNVEVLTLEQAAHLWCWEDPHMPHKSGEFRGYYETMRQAIETGELKPFVDLREAIAIKSKRRDAINYSTRVRRDDLKEFARKKKMQAPFLFESQRKDAWLTR